MSAISDEPHNVLQLRIKWAFAVLAQELDRGRALGYLPGDAVLSDESSLAMIDPNRRCSLDPVNPLARLGLSASEEDCVWLLACCELEPALERLLESVVGTRTMPAAFLERTFGVELERLHQMGAIAFAGAQTDQVRLAKVLLRVAKDARILLDATRSHTGTICPLLALADGVLDSIGRALSGGHSIVVMQGARWTGRRTASQAAVVGADRSHQLVDLRALPSDVASSRSELRAVALECRLTGKVPLLCNIDALDDEKGERLAIVANEFAPLIEGNILVTCGVQRPKIEWDRPVIVIEMGQPTHEQRARLWHEALGQGTEEDANKLANRYPLAPALIVRAAEAAKARCGERAMEATDIYAGIQAVLDDRLGAFAKRVTVTQTWDDVVLPPDQIESIVELMARVRGRHKVYEQWGFGAKVGKGLGVSALFSGPPGTGKTMVAGLIAKELGLELYQVDISKIVSKYIGETEKNLASLFDAAEAGHAILLFDEADSLFGKRTDVKSSNDRYANFETNYLLQRLETFTGICLLTSNHESNMDPAFQRRLSLHLRFELPDADERAKLWQAVLPAGAPIARTIDFAALGRRYAMSGGYIKNAALRAAFVAADKGEAISAAHLDRAARVEYEGMGKLAA
ncbi:MAG: ATP-binding protein [Deltaproteobacteria bacterium]|nr:ATP-binding protein [Deltaproteobacteria bacterium]